MSKFEQPLTPSIDEQSIVDFLQTDPDFFHRHPALVERLRIPHQEKGTVSLVEVQLARQRQRIAELESEITELMSVASHNEKIFRVYADLHPELIGATSLSQMNKRLIKALQYQLKISAVALKLNGKSFKLPSRYLSYAIEHEMLKQLVIQRMAARMHYFGPINEREKLALFGETPYVKSAALVALGEEGELGLLAIGSSDAQHFCPGMDDLLLSQLCRIISLLLPKLVPLHD